LDSSIIQ
jgi:Ca2+-binding EF-hand superfamily protein